MLTPPHLKPRVVLVEPICRGSRLQILVNVLGALEGLAEAVVVTRADYDSDHFRELTRDADVRPRVVAVQTDMGGSWMRNLSSAEFELFLDAIERIQAEAGMPEQHDLVFMALDDYLAAFSRAALRVRKLAARARVYVMKYRVEYLFKLSHGLMLRGLVLRGMTLWSLHASRARLVAFDERLSQFSGSQRAAILPDPWFGAYSPTQRERGRERVSGIGDDFVLLSLGKQDRRKGVDFLLSCVEELATVRGLKLLIVGTVAKEFEAAFADAVHRFPDVVVHVNRFVPESDLPGYFACADVFLLPYSADFTATSGTLARAAASGVPVLATDHGLVGHRVTTRGLGATFRVGDRVDFMREVRKLVGMSASERASMRAQSLNFAEECTLEKFEVAFRSVLALDNGAR